MNEKLEKRVNTLTNMIFFIVVVLFVGMRICSHYGLFSFLGEYGSYILGLVTQVGLIFFLPIFLLKVLTRSKTKEVFIFSNYRKVGAKIVFLAIVLGAVVFFLNVYVSNFFNNIIERFGYKHTSSTSNIDSTWWGLLLNLVFTAVLPAICEETLCRGILLNGNSMAGIRKSILISGVLFGLLHLNIEQFFYATLIGLFLAYLCWGCGSIVPCVIVHFMNNALSVCFAFANAKGWVIGSLFDRIANLVSKSGFFGFAIFFLCLSFMFYFAFYLAKIMFIETFKTSFVDNEKEFAKYSLRENYFRQIENIKNGENVSDLSREIEVLDSDVIQNFTDKHYEKIIRHAAIIEGNQKKIQMDNKSKIFLVGAIVLSAIVTILTFIWGLL